VPDQPAQPAAMLQPMIQTESVSIVDEIRTFSEGNPQPQHSENIYQNYYVNQVSGVKKMGVPFTI
jgi:phage-related protein